MIRNVMMRHEESEVERGRNRRCEERFNLGRDKWCECVMRQKANEG